jgi:hypothetical protein
MIMFSFITLGSMVIVGQSYVEDQFEDYCDQASTPKIDEIYTYV